MGFIRRLSGDMEKGRQDARESAETQRRIRDRADKIAAEAERRREEYMRLYDEHMRRGDLEGARILERKIQHLTDVIHRS